MLSGKQIAAARKEKGLTQAALAERLDVSAEAVSKWEKGVYEPKGDNAALLYEILEIPYIEETGRTLNARLFNEDHMSAFLKGKLSGGAFPEASKALAFAKEKHRGQFRKGPGKIPYISHPLTMACHAFAMGLEDDVLIAALLLHDVAEDCGVGVEDLPACAEVREIVALVTKPRGGFSEGQYYRDIEGNTRACLVKCIDRCNNLSTMSVAFSPERMADYIQETERYFPRLLRTVKECPVYNNAAWLLNYQIKSLLQTAKRSL